MTVKIVSTELKPRNGRKSFYGKALILDDLHGTRYLKSYNTVMCSADADGHVRRHGDYVNPNTGRRSFTTAAHLRSFFEAYAPDMDVKTFYGLPVEDRPELTETV